MLNQDINRYYEVLDLVKCGFLPLEFILFFGNDVFYFFISFAAKKQKVSFCDLKSSVAIFNYTFFTTCLKGFLTAKAILCCTATGCFTNCGYSYVSWHDIQVYFSNRE